MEKRYPLKKKQPPLFQKESKLFTYFGEYNKRKYMEKDIIKAEQKIHRIGGRLEEHYYRFRNIVETINEVYLPLFYLVGFNKKKFTDKVICILLDNNIQEKTKQGYIEEMIENVKNGKLKLENFLTKITLNKEFPTPDAKEKVFNRELHRALCFRFNEKMNTYLKEYGYEFSKGFYKFPLKLFRKALSLSPEGFLLDPEEFINIFEDYQEAHGSNGGKLHRAAAEAINRFFGGAIEITSKEMDRYFIIEDGIVKPNPKSINREGYLRLGYKAAKKKR